jgi:hypothetical protein
VYPVAPYAACTVARQKQPPTLQLTQTNSSTEVWRSLAELCKSMCSASWTSTLLQWMHDCRETRLMPADTHPTCAWGQRC